MSESFEKIKAKIDFKFLLIFLLLCGILVFEICRYYKQDSNKIIFIETSNNNFNRHKKFFKQYDDLFNPEKNFFDRQKKVYYINDPFEYIDDKFGDEIFLNDKFFKNQLKKMRELEKRYEKFMNYQFAQFKKDMANFKNLKKDKNESNQIKNRNTNEIITNLNTHTITFADEESFFDKQNKQFFIKIKVPQDINNDDIKITFDKNILSLSITKFDEVNKQSFNSQNYYSYARVFSTPETKATLKDIKKDVKDSLLTIIIPII